MQGQVTLFCERKLNFTTCRGALFKNALQQKFWISSAKSCTVYLGGAAQVIVVNLLNGLKVNEPFQFGLVLVWREGKREGGVKKKKSKLSHITWRRAVMQDLCQPEQPAPQSASDESKRFKRAGQIIVSNTLSTRGSVIGTSFLKGRHIFSNFRLKKYCWECF